MNTDQSTPAYIRHFDEGESYRWEDTDRLVYKPAGSHFKDITRQVLFGDEHGLDSEWRYFEIAPDGHSTLERHNHVHAVLVLRGRGSVVVGDRIESIGRFDLVHVPPQTWHQFLADDEPLGFLCLVACDRDRPSRPSEQEADALRRNPTIGNFIRL